MALTRTYIGLLIILLIPMLSADRGMVAMGPAEVTLQESGQNAIVAWNGTREVLILSTDVKSSDPVFILEVLPLPSNPTVEEGTFDSFTALTEIINKKAKDMRGSEIEYTEAPSSGEGPHLEITFHQQIGAHDVTVVKVYDLDYFLTWVDDFTVSKGFGHTGVSPEFKQTVSSYLKRDITFFVFDVIDTGTESLSIDPLVYTFETPALYYPLEITATSDVGSSDSEVSIFFITEKLIDRPPIVNCNLTPGVGFFGGIELTHEELEDVSPEIADLFDSAYVMNAYYRGQLSTLKNDLIITEDDLYSPSTPTRTPEPSQAISPPLGFEILSALWDLTGDSPVWVKIPVAIAIVISALGIPSLVVVLARLAKKKLEHREGGSILAFALPVLVVGVLLFSNTLWLAVPFLLFSFCAGIYGIGELWSLLRRGITERR